MVAPALSVRRKKTNQKVHKAQVFLPLYIYSAPRAEEIGFEDGYDAEHPFNDDGSLFSDSHSGCPIEGHKQRDNGLR